MKTSTRILLALSGTILLFMMGLLYLKMRSEIYCCIITFLDSATSGTMFTVNGTCRDDGTIDPWHYYGVNDIESEADHTAK
ncbi:hypothetical protein FAZ19_00055 [Sphingobacterium alkalisoli]|uniref:Uncharacterized protein n=1 Tax=Sphingobacterium alkalisoli TaxID=1874115 RepID=A0A4U0H8P2_9SPHI|nr:hypothetical protein [Sphingobacterium alkalisoli]TJY67694.1 hypothetical protein FAZ19_00055 [Sphingobacterium alkalisoli]